MRVSAKQLGLKNVAKSKGARVADKNFADRTSSRERTSPVLTKRMSAKKNPAKVRNIWFPEAKTIHGGAKDKGRRN